MECNNCNELNAILLCSYCYPYYCSRQCQRLDWPKHKLECKPIPTLVESALVFNGSEKTPTSNAYKKQEVTAAAAAAATQPRPKNLEDERIVVNHPKNTADAFKDKAASAVETTTKSVSSVQNRLIRQPRPESSMTSIDFRNSTINIYRHHISAMPMAVPQLKCQQNSSSYHYQNQGSLPRNGTAGASYNGGAGAHNTLNLSELDSLLQDLSNAKYNSNFEKKEHTIPVNQYSNPGSKYNTYNSNASIEERPTVDSLLNEMANASLYAVPNGTHPKSPTPGRHVTITVRETKTEKLTGPEGPVGSIEEKTVQKKDTYTPNYAPPPHGQYASSATKELDDLMASLSDFKQQSTSDTSSTYQEIATGAAVPNRKSKFAKFLSTIKCVLVGDAAVGKSKWDGLLPSTLPPTPTFWKKLFCLA